MKRFVAKGSDATISRGDARQSHSQRENGAHRCHALCCSAVGLRAAYAEVGGDASNTGSGFTKILEILEGRPSLVTGSNRSGDHQGD
jgi:hypothetical protein